MCFFLVSNNWHKKFDPKMNNNPYNTKLRVFQPFKIALFSMAEKHEFWHYKNNYSFLDKFFYANY